MPNIKELDTHQPESIAVIKLQGEPYQTSSIDCTRTLEELVQTTNYPSRIEQALQNEEQNLKPLFTGGYYGIDAKIKHGKPLTFEEAFSLMSFVSMGVNKAVYRTLSPHIQVGATDPDTIFYQSIALLSAMSAKESYIGLTPTEIAGLVSATLNIDTIVRIPVSKPVIGIGGMGGDRGYPLNGENSKLFSLSTLTAINLASFSHTHKHHSYPNTSKVAGQSAIEAFGAKSDQNSLETFERIQEQTGLLMTSCHTTRLIHTLSHRLKGETINHIVGPLAIPVSADTPMTAFIGVNHNVHPETIIQTLAKIQAHHTQTYQNSVAFCGLDGSITNTDILNPLEYYPQPQLKEQVVIDEVAPPPYPTMAAFLVNGKNMGTYIIRTEDFLPPEILKSINPQDLFIPNTTDSILSANKAVIQADDFTKVVYVAMSTALAIFTQQYAHYSQALNQQTRQINSQMLQHCFRIALENIQDGNMAQNLINYVNATNNI